MPWSHSANRPIPKLYSSKGAPSICSTWRTFMPGLIELANSILLNTPLSAPLGRCADSVSSLLSCAYAHKANQQNTETKAVSNARKIVRPSSELGTIAESSKPQDHFFWERANGDIPRPFGTLFAHCFLQHDNKVMLAGGASGPGHSPRSRSKLGWTSTNSCEQMRAASKKELRKKSAARWGGH